jgi:hypothetical protein
MILLGPNTHRRFAHSHPLNAVRIVPAAGLFPGKDHPAFPEGKNASSRPNGLAFFEYAAFLSERS